MLVAGVTQRLVTNLACIRGVFDAGSLISGTPSNDAAFSA